MVGLLLVLLGAPVGDMPQPAQQGGVWTPAGHWAPVGLRLVATEPLEDDAIAWFEEVESGEVLAVRVGDELGGGSLVGIDAESARVGFRIDDAGRKGKRALPHVFLSVVPVFGTLPAALFGDATADGPLFLERIESEAAVVRSRRGESLRLSSGQELCQGWSVAELRPASEFAPEGLLVLARGERRLVIRPAWP